MEDIFKEGVEAKVLYFRGYFIWCYDSPVYKDKNFVYLNVSGRPDWLDYTTKDKMTCPSIRIDLATDQLHFETPELAAPQK